MWAEVRVKRERVREYTRAVAKWTEGVGHGVFFAAIMGLNFVVVKERRRVCVQDVFVDKLVVKQFESAWVCIGVEEEPF